MSLNNSNLHNICNKCGHACDYFHGTPPLCKPSAPLHSLLGREDILCRVQQECNPDSTCQWPCCRCAPGWPLESGRSDSGCRCTLMQKKKEEAKRDRRFKCPGTGLAISLPVKMFYKSIIIYSFTCVSCSHPSAVHSSLIQSQQPWCSLGPFETKGCSPVQVQKKNHIFLFFIAASSQWFNTNWPFLLFRSWSIFPQ